MESAIRSQTIQRLREPLVSTGSPDRRFDRSSSLSALLPRHPRAAQAVISWPITPPRVFVALAGYAGWATWLVNHGRNPVAVRSTEAPKDRARQSPLAPQPWRHLVGCPAVPPARRRTQPGGSPARRPCHSSAGSGCAGRPDGGCERPERHQRGRHDNVPGVRRRSGGYH